LIIPTMFFVALITFTLAHMAPGSPFDLNANRPLSQATIDRINRYYGVDKPIPEQFVIYMGNLLKGDLGLSFTRQRPVVDIIGQGIGTTFQLGLGALAFALAFSIPLGIISALRQNTIVDYLSMLVATIGTTIPGFVLAIFLIYIFGVSLHLLPFVGWGSWQHMVMPMFVLGLGAGGFLTRITRASMLEAIRQDYVRTARSKGLHERAVIVGHALKNALIPVVTFAGIYFAILVTTAIVVETVFAWPGLGRLAYDGITSRDFPVIQAVVLTTAVIVSAVNLGVDCLYAFIDPRIRYGR